VRCSASLSIKQGVELMKKRSKQYAELAKSIANLQVYLFLLSKAWRQMTGLVQPTESKLKLH
jgi:hypothetical protein